MKPHAHIIPNLTPKTGDPSTWFHVAYFNGRGEWQLVSGPMTHDEARKKVRAFNRKQGRKK